MEKNKNKILKGKPEYPTYYEFGRSQALNDVHKRKIAINSIIKTENDLRIENVDSGCGVYSGFYLTSEYNIYIDDINDVLKTTRFINYVKLLRKYKSGGYYTFSSNDAQQYINYGNDILIVTKKLV